MENIDLLSTDALEIYLLLIGMELAERDGEELARPWGKDAKEWKDYLIMVAERAEVFFGSARPFESDDREYLIEEGYRVEEELKRRRKVIEIGNGLASA